MRIIPLIFKIIIKIESELKKFFCFIYNSFLIKANNIKAEKGYKIKGIPFIRVSTNGYMSIGKNFKLNNAISSNPIGRNHRSVFYIKGKLIIGNNVGMSSVAIVSLKQIIIEDNVTVGGNVVIYDTDFHSLDSKERTSMPEIKENIKTSSVKISKNAFIGAHSIILKGVSIGENSIIAAGSVISKDIPANEMWGGNPARLIKKL